MESATVLRPPSTGLSSILLFIRKDQNMKKYRHYIDAISLLFNLSDDSSWITSIPHATRTRRMNERDLSKLAQTLAKDWEMVMYDFGLSKADVEHAKMEQMTATMMIYTCLYKWKTRTVNGANLENFVKTVAGCPSVTVDWDRMKRIAQQM